MYVFVNIWVMLGLWWKRILKVNRYLSERRLFVDLDFLIGLFYCIILESVLYIVVFVESNLRVR